MILVFRDGKLRTRIKLPYGGKMDITTAIVRFDIGKKGQVIFLPKNCNAN